MGLFEFAQGWDVRIFGALDARMNQTLQKGLEVARSTVHVRTGKLKASINGGFNQDTRTIMIWADTPYALVEEQRAPIPAHSYLGPAMQAMAGLWNGHYNLEAHYMNAAPKGKSTTMAELAGREKQWRKKNLGFLANRKTKVVVRRWHKRWLNNPSPNDATTPIL